MVKAAISGAGLRGAYALELNCAIGESLIGRDLYAGCWLEGYRLTYH